MSWLLRYNRSGSYMHVRFYVGADAEHRAYAGTVTLREEEWEKFPARRKGVEEIEGFVPVWSAA